VDPGGRVGPRPLILTGHGGGQHKKAPGIWSLDGRRAHFMSLLEDALAKQVLRQAGAVYQFRHAQLQDLLSSGTGRLNE
jgi:hypothetical protein